MNISINAKNSPWQNSILIKTLGKIRRNGYFLNNYIEKINDMVNKFKIQLSSKIREHVFFPNNNYGTYLKIAQLIDFIGTIFPVQNREL